MLLSDLLTDADKAGEAADAFQVLLATRTVAGKELEPGKVELSEAGALQVDHSAQEVDVLPVGLMTTPGTCITIADVRRKLREDPMLGDFAVTGVRRFKRLTDGGNVQATDPIIGTYTLADQRQIWLLLYPKEQWPEKWFGA